MITKKSMAKRVFVISDLHLGGSAPQMMSRPDTLAEFITQLSSISSSHESIELVMAGDIIDFLAIEPSTSFTANAKEAREKLLRTMLEPPFDVVFLALRALLSAGHELTLLIGNHDIELAHPLVQEALLNHIASNHRLVKFIDNGQAYKIGRALIEHGNRYDDANLNDWDGLRTMTSAHSRFEQEPVQVEVSVGSQLVDAVINPIKKDYPFIDLIQPQNELVALLLFAFEPSLAFHLNKIAKLLHANHASNANKKGKQPNKTSAVGFKPIKNLYDKALAATFPSGIYDALHKKSGQIGIGKDIVRIAWKSREDSLAKMISQNETIPKDRLQQIRLVMQRLLLDDEGNRLDGDTAQYGKAAHRIIESSNGEIEAVIMGHTHLARSVGPTKRASYINTGTWADIIRVPNLALDTNKNEPAADEALISFLTSLLNNNRPDMSRPYAELHIAEDGAVLTNELKWTPKRATSV